MKLKFKDHLPKLGQLQIEDNRFLANQVQLIIENRCLQLLAAQIEADEQIGGFLCSAHCCSSCESPLYSWDSVFGIRRERKVGKINI